MRGDLKAAMAAEIVVLFAAVIFLLGFLTAGIGHERPMLSLCITIFAVLCASALLVYIWHRTLQRESLVRRLYISSGGIYNNEFGFAPMSKISDSANAYDVVTFAADALAQMSYGFEIAERPEEFDPRYAIDSSIFVYHASDPKGDLSEGIVIDDWQGRLRERLRKPHGITAWRPVETFDGAGELARLIEDHCVLVPQSDQGDAC